MLAKDRTPGDRQIKPKTTPKLYHFFFRFKYYNRCTTVNVLKIKFDNEWTIRLIIRYDVRRITS